MADGTITGVVPGIGIAGGGEGGHVEVSLDPSANIAFSGSSIARQNDPLVGARTTQIPNCRWVMNQLDVHGGGGGGGGAGLWVGPNPPENPGTHPFWFDDAHAQLFVHDGTTWVIAVNPGGGGGPSPGGPGYDTVNPSVNAAGTNQGGATSLGSQTSMVTGGTGGVRWDSPQVGDHRFVHNGIATAIIFYPPTGAQINNLAANAGIFIQPNMTGFFKAVTSSRLITVP